MSKFLLVRNETERKVWVGVERGDFAFLSEEVESRVVVHPVKPDQKGHDERGSSRQAFLAVYKNRLSPSEMIVDEPRDLLEKDRDLEVLRILEQVVMIGQLVGEG